MIISIALIVTLALISYHPKQIQMVMNLDENQIEFILLPEEQKIVGWEKDGIIHYFFPSYVQSNKILLEDGYSLLLNENETQQIIYNENCVLQVVDSNDTMILSRNVCFHHSQNVYTMYIDLFDKGAEDINNDERISSAISLFSVDGKMEYNGLNDEIKGRGNSTWTWDKKPYTLHLNKEYSLCNMKPSNKWLLLANFGEGTNMANKMLYDLSGKIGMEYYSNSEWVDLYINGEYYGNYLLCEKIEVDKSRVNIQDLEKKNFAVYPKEELEHYNGETYKGYITNQNPDEISGGYLIEKDLWQYQVLEPCGFGTDRNSCFTINSPRNASVEQVQYIRNFVQKIDDMIVNEDDKILEYIDVPSFNRRFILEELCLSYDGFVTSCFFYKKPNEDKLYAGPVWDYDMAFGEKNGPYLQYYYSVLDTVEFRGEDYMLDWDSKLHKNEEYRNRLAKTYAQVYPILKKCLYEDIDDYADKIRTSVILDGIRWQNNEAGHYASFDNNVRYIKFFMRSRINMMNERYGIDEVLEADDLTEEIHTIRCLYEGELYEFQVKDGDFFKEADLPPYDNDKYSGWRYERDSHFFCELLPVFEDVILLPNERG